MIGRAYDRRCPGVEAGNRGRARVLAAEAPQWIKRTVRTAVRTVVVFPGVMPAELRAVRLAQQAAQRSDVVGRQVGLRVGMVGHLERRLAREHHVEI